MNTHKQVRNAQPQFINKVVDDRVKVQRQVPHGEEMKQSIHLRIQFSDSMEDISCTTENRCRKTVPESSEENRDSTVTASTGNDAIHDCAHDAGKDLRRTRYSHSGCCLDCQRNGRSLEHPLRDLGDDPLRSGRQWRCRRKPNTANMRRSCRVMETSRAKSGCDCPHPSVVQDM